MRANRRNVNWCHYSRLVDGNDTRSKHLFVHAQQNLVNLLRFSPLVTFKREPSGFATYAIFRKFMTFSVVDWDFMCCCVAVALLYSAAEYIFCTLILARFEWNSGTLRGYFGVYACMVHHISLLDEEAMTALWKSFWIIFLASDLYAVAWNRNNSVFCEAWLGKS